MAKNLQKIKKKINSVKNSSKITKAMELVSGSKMRKSMMAALASRLYAGFSWQMVRRLSRDIYLDKGDFLNNFFRPAAGGRDVLLVVSSNKGLCGAFNSSVAKAAIKFLALNENAGLRIIAWGVKGALILKSKGISVEKVFRKDEAAVDILSVKEVGDFLFDGLRAGTIARVFVVFTDFRSSLKQTPVIKMMIPMTEDNQINDLIKEVAENESSSFDAISTVAGHSGTDGSSNKLNVSGGSYLYEPSARRVLENLVPAVLTASLFQVLLESNASEHSARMIAMKNATDSASDILESLILKFNRNRQAAITGELAEISAGRMALG